MILGAHESAAGGAYKAIERAVEDSCESLQIFTKNSNRWKSKALDPKEIDRFQKALSESPIAPEAVMAHAAYLINLASPNDELYEKSIAALIDETQRCAQLGIPLLVVHPGAHVGSGTEAGIARVVAAINRVHAETRGLPVAILLENTAGQGTVLGRTFEELATMLEGIEEADRTGICFDTCHAFAAELPIHTPIGYDETFTRFDTLIGVKRLRAIHLNDSKKPFGCRVDRHENIGVGHLGIDFFERFVNDPTFAGIPAILETPPLEDGRPGFKENLTRLRGLLQGAA
ncbi:MAG: deoxyribonuclease IV [Deltaproteobacteria bacterium]|nr:MAG: deoxyribonuclease IV [Deltaproteobacteria bacterium]